MDYIISLSDGRYFCGWDTLDGSMKFRTERSLAYRMRCHNTSEGSGYHPCRL